MKLSEFLKEKGVIIHNVDLKEFDKNFISIKEHEKIVNKRQKVFLEISSKLANKMIDLKEQTRKKLKKKLCKCRKGRCWGKCKNCLIIDEMLK